jgi:hypothetical protein
MHPWHVKVLCFLLGFKLQNLQKKLDLNLEKKLNLSERTSNPLQFFQKSMNPKTCGNLNPKRKPLRNPLEEKPETVTPSRRRQWRGWCGR